MCVVHSMQLLSNHFGTGLLLIKWCTGDGHGKCLVYSNCRRDEGTCEWDDDARLSSRSFRSNFMYDCWLVLEWDRGIEMQFLDVLLWQPSLPAVRSDESKYSLLTFMLWRAYTDAILRYHLLISVDHIQSADYLPTLTSIRKVGSIEFSWKSALYR